MKTGKRKINDKLYGNKKVITKKDKHPPSGDFHHKLGRSSLNWYWEKNYGKWKKNSRIIFWEAPDWWTLHPFNLIGNMNDNSFRQPLVMEHFSSTIFSRLCQNYWHKIFKIFKCTWFWEFINVWIGINKQQTLLKVAKNAHSTSTKPGDMLQYVNVNHFYMILARGFCPTKRTWFDNLLSRLDNPSDDRIDQSD